MYYHPIESPKPSKWERTGQWTFIGILVMCWLMGLVGVGVLMMNLFGVGN
jgi:hypothetical protein